MFLEFFKKKSRCWRKLWCKNIPIVNITTKFEVVSFLLVMKFVQMNFFSGYVKFYLLLKTSKYFDSCRTMDFVLTLLRSGTLYKEVSKSNVNSSFGILFSNCLHFHDQETFQFKKQNLAGWAAYSLWWIFPNRKVMGINPASAFNVVV